MVEDCKLVLTDEKYGAGGYTSPIVHLTSTMNYYGVQELAAHLNYLCRSEQDGRV